MTTTTQQKTVYAASPLQESQSSSCTPLNHLLCFSKKFWFSLGCELQIFSSFSPSFQSECTVCYEVFFIRSLKSLFQLCYFVTIALSLSTIAYLNLGFQVYYLQIVFLSSIQSVLISRRKYFYSASIPRSFLYPEMILPSSLILQSNRSTHSILLNWSFTNIFSMSSSHSLEIGLIYLGMRSSVSVMTFMSWLMELDSNGQQPKSISNSTTPKDQMSALRVQIYSLSISGAMQIGEPSMVCAMLTSSILQNPKSPSFTFPSEKKILSGFRSRCIMLFLLSSLKAQRSCLKMTRAQSYFSCFFFCKWLYKVPPLQYQQTKQKLLGVLRVQTKRTMFSFFSDDKMLISLMANCYNLGLALKEVLGMTLTAYSSLDFWCTALKTCPQTPLPMGYWRRQFYTSLLI